MNGRGFLVTGMVALALASRVSGEPQERPPDLPDLASALGLTKRGVERWLDRLGATADGPTTERLVIVTATGEPLFERQGDHSSVRVDPELDRELHRPGTAAVLVHNHPNDIGLSSADLAQLVKPGVAAIVAIGHDGSMFVASAGPRFDRDFFEQRQYTLARAEVLKRLRVAWPAHRASIAASYAHFSHLVTLVLARAGIVHYWFELSGSATKSYQDSQVGFGQVVVGAVHQLKKTQ